MTTYHVVQLNKTFDIIGVGTFIKGTKNVNIVPVDSRITGDTAMSEITKKTENTTTYNINMEDEEGEEEGEEVKEGVEGEVAEV